ncbi:MAG: fumarylacetoacetate hydrolase family protein [Chthonomonadales bacterium]
MSLCRYGNRLKSWWGWVENGNVSPISDELVRRVFQSPGEDGLLALRNTKSATPIEDVELLAPILPDHEIWAAGVTYESSKFARMAESPEGGDFYAKVYVADRPEIFFKGTPGRTVGQGGEVRIRKDSKWNVPEPELTVIAAATGQILGFTIGNDMSSRDIEGENPLYLPQAKVYDGCCAIGPVIVPASLVDPANLGIELRIFREGSLKYQGETNTAKMKRNVRDLVDWLFRENVFPNGTVLLTGTGLIPPEEFSLLVDDVVEIEIEGIGVLRNVVNS